MEPLLIRPPGAVRNSRVSLDCGRSIAPILVKGRMIREWLGPAVLALLLAALASTVVDADEADNVALVAAFNSSGYDLFKQFVTAPGNVAFSPYSIGAAMAMVSSGARSDTASEMALVLHQPLDRALMDAANSDILKALDGHSAPTMTPACQKGLNVEQCESMKSHNRECRRATLCTAAPRIHPSTSLHVASAVMLTKDAVVLDAYVKLLKEDYAAEVFRNVGLEQVNDWVSRMTEGRINHILDQLPRKGIVLIDAVHFKQPWQMPFLAAATTNEDFHVSPTTTIKVATMHQRGYFPLMSGPGFRAIRLPYLNESLSMVIALPDTVDGATALAQQLDADKLAKLFGALRSSDVYTALSLPRFRTSFSAELKNKYQQLGLLRPFDQNRADFSGIAGRPNERVKIWIDNILHRTALEVGENGTEAVAATANSLVEITSTWRPRSEPFNVDRPFLFYITNDTTGVILFAGRISDPSKTN
jgi:serpin B